MFRIIGSVVRILYTAVSAVPKRGISGGAVSGESETHGRALTLAKKGQCEERRVGDNRPVARRDKDGMNCRHLTKAAQREKNPPLPLTAVTVAMTMTKGEQCFVQPDGDGASGGTGRGSGGGEEEEAAPAPN